MTLFIYSQEENVLEADLAAVSKTFVHSGLTLCNIIASYTVSSCILVLMFKFFYFTYVDFCIFCKLILFVMTYFIASYDK